ncbi:MAG TPA: GNAT family N-acetyltransferase [Acidimicrobiales bacterium]|nr:GNAT family N-acetyltransferase [Acidimicrobiales bacterium]
MRADRPGGGPGYRVRAAGPGDVAFLADVVIEATRAQGRWPKDFDEAEWRARFLTWTEGQVGGELPDSTTSVIELGGEPVGRLRVVRDGQRIELSGIQLLPRVQGRGIGTRVIEELEAEAVKSGLPLELAVERDNPRARMLYERLGFVKVAESEGEGEEMFRWQQAGSEPGAEGGRMVGRHFEWQDMFVSPGSDPRGIGGVFLHHGDERTVLAGYLGDYRLTLELKCAGLDAEAMARRSVEPSDLSLLGLVRHLSDAERYWFRQVMAGEDAPSRYRASAGDDHDKAFSEAVGDPEAVALAWANWREEVAFAERFVAAADDLGLTKPYVGRGGHHGEVSLREVLVHMVEEYARHIGHADLLRERIDGRVGL